VTPRPALERLDEFISELEKIRDIADPMAQARELRAIDRRARAVLGHAGDEAVFLAANELVDTRRRTHLEVAQTLGVTRYRVSNAITDYRNWVHTQNHQADVNTHPADERDHTRG
jgi:hypothetical protein